jgi:hypothetical protein
VGEQGGCDGNPRWNAMCFPDRRCFQIYIYTPSEPRTLEFVGPKMKTWFWGRFPKKKIKKKHSFYLKNPSFFAQLDDVYKYLRKGKRLQIPMEWRHLIPKP